MRHDRRVKVFEGECLDLPIKSVTGRSRCLLSLAAPSPIPIKVAKSMGRNQKAGKLQGKKGRGTNWKRVVKDVKKG